MNKVEEKALRDFKQLKEELRPSEFFEYCQTLIAYGLCIGLNAHNAERLADLTNIIINNSLHGLLDLRSSYKEQQEEEENARD